MLCCFVLCCVVKVVVVDVVFGVVVQGDIKDCKKFSDGPKNLKKCKNPMIFRELI